ncbi:MAG: SdiA-regulated domain-containing protein [Candidatus Latescibacterota bacterium]|nr:MAG: SdiA-regulated domain-containing protein [Candidatus Latescibacterota bacterium]
MALHDYLLAGDEAKKLYLVSAFTSTLKESQAYSKCKVVSHDGTDTLYSDEGVDKLFLISGTFTTTVKSSYVHTAQDGKARGISWDGTNTVWAGGDNDKFFLQSGEFSSTIKTSFDHSAIQLDVNGVCADELSDTNFAGKATNVWLYLMSGQFSSTINASQDVSSIDSKPLGCGWDGTDTSFTGDTNDKVYQTSGRFSTTMKSSFDFTAISAKLKDLETFDTDARLGEGETTTTSQSTTRSTSQSTSQSTTRSTSQSTSQSTTQSTTASSSQSTITPLPSQTTIQSTSASTSQSTSQSTTRSTSQSTTQSTTRSTSQTTTRSTSQSTSQTTTRSTSQSTSQTTTRSTSQSTSQTTTRSTSQSTTQSTTASTSQSTTRSTSQSTTASTSQSTTYTENPISYEQTWDYDDQNVDYYDDTDPFYETGFSPPPAWSSGQGVFAYGTLNDLVPSVNTTLANSGADCRSYYFVKDFTISSKPDLLKVEINAIRDDAVVIWVNGTEVARINVTNPLSHGMQADGAAGEGTPYSWELTGAELDPFVTGTNRIAAFLVNASAGSSDAGFDLEMFAHYQGVPGTTSQSTSLSTSASTSQSISTSNSTTASTSASTTHTDPPFFCTDRDFSEIENNDINSGTDAMTEASGIEYWPDEDELLAVSDDIPTGMRALDLLVNIKRDISYPAGRDDIEDICYLGGSWFETEGWNFAILEEGDSVLDAAIVLCKIDPGAGSITEYEVHSLPDIPWYSGTYGGEGAEGLAFDPNTGKFYVINQADTQSDVGVWEVDTANGWSVTRLYTWSDTVLVSTVSDPVAFAGAFHGANLAGSVHGSFPRSLFILTRNTTDDRRLVIQLDTDSGETLSTFQHAKTGQVEGMCFDTSRGDMYLCSETASPGPNWWRFSTLGALTSSVSTSLTTSQSTSQSTTRSTSQSTTQSTTRSTSQSTTQSTTRSTSQSTTQSTTASTPVSTSQSTTASSSNSTSQSTTTPPPFCSPAVLAVRRTEATIHFEAQQASDAYIEYGPTLGSIDLHSTGVQTNATIFEFTIPQDETDYEPGSRIYWRLRSRVTGTVDYHTGISHNFVLARAYDDYDPWTWVFAADSRSSSGATTSDEFKEDFWPAVGPPSFPEDEFLVFGGDWLNSGTGDAYWRAVRNATEGIGRESEKCGDLPVFQVIGNHEGDAASANYTSRKNLYPLGVFLNEPNSPSQTDDTRWHERYFHYVWGNALFIHLPDDDAIYNSGGYIQWSELLTWFENICSAYKHYKFKFLVTHTCADESDPNHGDTIANFPANQAHIRNFLDDYGFTAHLHGHYHGWRYHENTDGSRSLCANFGAPVTHTTVDEWVSGDPAGRRFWRIRMNQEWDETDQSYVTNPDAATFELVDPQSTDTSVEERHVVYAFDNPAESGTTSQSTTQSTSASTSLSTTQSTTASTSASTSASTTASTSQSTTRSTSASTTASTSASTSNSTTKPPPIGALNFELRDLSTILDIRSSDSSELDIKDYSSNLDLKEISSH